MPINVTNSSLVVLTRQLNSLNLAKLDAAKLLAAQLAAQDERKIDGDRASSKLAEELRQSIGKDKGQSSVDESLDRDSRAKRERFQQLVRQDEDETSQTRLARLLPPKAQLSPSDELETFAGTSGIQTKSAIGADAQSAQLLLTSVNQGEAIAEDGSSVDVEIITPNGAAKADTTSALVLTLASRAQAATAALYARNSDVVFQSYPLGVAA